MAITITGQMKISTLQERFNEEFGLTLRVYDGRSFADPSKTIAAVRKKKGSGELSVRKSMQVGNLEDKIMDLYGIKVQIAGSDDSYLCDNSLTLAKALEKDALKLTKKKEKHSGDEDTKENIRGNKMVDDNNWYADLAKPLDKDREENIESLIVKVSVGRITNDYESGMNDGVISSQTGKDKIFEIDGEKTGDPIVFYYYRDENWDQYFKIGDSVLEIFDYVDVEQDVFDKYESNGEDTSKVMISSLLKSNKIVNDVDLGIELGEAIYNPEEKLDELAEYGDGNKEGDWIYAIGEDAALHDLDDTDAKSSVFIEIEYAEDIPIDISGGDIKISGSEVFSQIANKDTRLTALVSQG